MAHQENCRELLSSLSDYVDGTLGEELCTELGAPPLQLRELPNCR